MQGLIHIGLLLFSIGMLGICLLLYNENPRWMSGKNAVSHIANSTLEIYLMQITLLPIMKQLPFPVSACTYWLTALLGGVLFHSLMEAMKGRLIGGKAAK